MEKEVINLSSRENRGFRFCIFPGYNWCGPGCNGPGAPINEVDAACKAHDVCYRQNKDRCHCDNELLRRLRPYLYEDTLMGRHARILYKYMQVQTKFTCYKSRKY
ncbi:phospholipase [Lederbergia citrisecunda]|uniref:phospholipase n=1 Tax=Lederbergia citrisecunda TaxID=2833583 RepID=UPI003D2E99E9